MRCPCRKCLVLPACNTQCESLSRYKKRTKMTIKIILLGGIILPIFAVLILTHMGITVPLTNPIAISLLVVLAISEALFFTQIDSIIVEILTKGYPI